MARADAQRNVEALLAAAEEEFATVGVGVGLRAIAARAGVTTPTLYRHFPKRSDLITAVFRRDVDECVAFAATVTREHDPWDALVRWIAAYADLITSKRGLAAALHLGDPAFEALPVSFQQHLGPALEGLLERAATAGAVRDGIDPLDVLGAVAKLCIPPIGTDDHGRADRMIAMLLDGMRYRAQPRARPASRQH